MSVKRKKKSTSQRHLGPLTRDMLWAYRYLDSEEGDLPRPQRKESLTMWRYAQENRVKFMEKVMGLRDRLEAKREDKGVEDKELVARIDAILAGWKGESGE